MGKHCVKALRLNKNKRNALNRLLCVVWVRLHVGSVSGYLFVLCPTYFDFEECTAKRWPAVHRLQEGHFGLLDGHTCLFVVGGNDKLENTHISTQ